MDPSAGVLDGAAWVLVLGCSLLIAASAPVPVVLDRNGRGVTLSTAFFVAVPPLVGAGLGALAIGLALATFGLIWELGLRHFRMPGTFAGTSTWSPLSSALVGAVATIAFASTAVLMDGRGGSSVVLGAEIAATATAAVATDLLLRWRGWLGAPRVALGKVLLADACLASAGAVVVLTTEQGGPLSGLIAGVPIALLVAAFTAYARADRTTDETFDALSTLPEATGTAPVGHGPRVLLLVERMAVTLRLGDEDVELVRAAARLHHLSDVVPAGPVLDRMPAPAGTLRIVEACRRPARRTDDLLPAVVRVACTFDVARSEDPALTATVFALRDTHESGAEAWAVEALLTTLDKEPELFQQP